RRARHQAVYSAWPARYSWRYESGIWGLASMTIPGMAPRTPASHVPDVSALPLAERHRVLAEMPDVPLLVLRVIVRRSLQDGPVVGRHVAHDRRRDSQDDLRLIGHDDGVDLALAVLHSVINQGSADRKGKIRIVDYAHEVRRVELGRAGRACDSTDRHEG